jgi:sulfonate transport system permease protein
MFALWELAARLGWLNEHTIGAPSTAVSTGWTMIRDGTLPAAVHASTRRVAFAVLLGLPVGAGLAVVAGMSTPGDALIDANIQILRYVPILAIQPLLILWFGIGETTKVVLLALGVAFPVYINTQHAVRTVLAQHRELSQVLHLSSWQRIRRLVGPGAAPGFLVGVRHGSATVWLLLIFAEQTNASSGLGRLMANAQAFSKIDVIVVVIVVYTTLGIGCDLAIRTIERFALRWQRPQ